MIEPRLVTTRVAADTPGVAAAAVLRGTLVDEVSAGAISRRWPLLCGLVVRVQRPGFGC